MSRLSKIAQYGLLAAGLALAPAFAQTSGADATGTAPAATPNPSGTTTANPNTPANGYGNPYNNPDQDRSHNFGWIGLFGLLGLSGLMRRDRRDYTGVTRDDRINPRV
jgi:hypothetical protein